MRSIVLFLAAVDEAKSELAFMHTPFSAARMTE